MEEIIQFFLDLLQYHQPNMEGRQTKASPKAQQPPRNKYRLEIKKHCVGREAEGTQRGAPYFGIFS
jgi:hypothetical protein